ncbi:MAG: SIMPL domain-containing protein [Firmicutes bacterium]|nr:SIMPL domain-containing protein [Bacillota bacterium]
MQNDDRKIWIVMATVFLCVLCMSAAGVWSFSHFLQYKQTVNGGITVTGSASRDFDSDLIVWRGSFSRTAGTMTEAYTALKNDAGVIRKYLSSNSVKDSEVVFSSVSITQNYTNNYNNAGNVISSTLTGYTLSQDVTIQSTNVDNIEKISRDITELIDSGVNFISNPPEYYYTKLNELKLEMIKEATSNASQRAKLVADNSNARLGKLISSNLGVFQITGQNSASEEYSYGGAFNTSSRAKTMSVTVQLYYAVK